MPRLRTIFRLRTRVACFVISTGVFAASVASPVSLQAQGGAAAPPPPAPPVASPAPSDQPSAGPAPNASTPASADKPNPVPPVVPPPQPTPLSQSALIDSLSPSELQEAINLLRANYIHPADVDDRSMARATLSGLLAKLDSGARLMPKPGGPGSPAPVEGVPDAFYTEILGQRTGYVRLGGLTKDHLGDLDKALKNFNDHSLPAVILDLRATPSGTDFDLAAEVIRRFVVKGKPLFTLRKPSINQERLLTSNGDPGFNGLTVLLVDGDTAGTAETVAAVVRYYNHALVVGENTAGQGVEYADLGVGGSSVLRVAVSQVLLPGNLDLFPNGVKPDVPISMPKADKIAVFKASADKGIAQFVYEVERPHLNEAALLHGTTPELDAARDAQAARRRGAPPPKPPLRDTVIQRALDLVATISVFDPGKPAQGN